MLSIDSNWTWTLVFATLAITLATVGLGLEGLYPDSAPLVSTALLVSSLLFTGAAFGRLAMRVRRLELENEGLIAELSQEFDRVKDRLDVYQEALAASRSADVVEGGPRRITVR